MAFAERSWYEAPWESSFTASTPYQPPQRAANQPPALPPLNIEPTLNPDLAALENDYQRFRSLIGAKEVMRMASKGLPVFCAAPGARYVVTRQFCKEIFWLHSNYVVTFLYMFFYESFIFFQTIVHTLIKVFILTNCNYLLKHALQMISLSRKTLPYCCFLSLQSCGGTNWKQTGDILHVSQHESILQKWTRTVYRADDCTNTKRDHQVPVLHRTVSDLFVLKTTLYFDLSMKWISYFVISQIVICRYRQLFECEEQEFNANVSR